MRRIARPRVTIAVLALLTLVGAGTIAYAAIPDSTGAINACYGRTGQLRAVDAVADCRHAETHIALGGPTFGYEFANADLLPIEDKTTLVGSLKLPAGQYLVHAKLDLLGMSSTEEAFVVCNLTVGGTAGFSDAVWNTLEPGMPGRLPSESAALQTSLVLPAGGAILLTCVRPEGGPEARARYRKIDAVRVDGLTTG